MSRQVVLHVLCSVNTAYERDHATEEEENEGEDPEPSKEDDVSSHSLEDGTGPAADSAVSTAAASQQWVWLISHPSSALSYAS